MSLKKIKILDIFLIFGLCFLFHFLYEWFPNSLFSIFFPVNESIWEHMKIIYTPIIFYTIIDFLLFTKNNVKVSNIFTSAFFSSFLSIIVYLIIYLPIYHLIGENMVVSIVLLFLIIIFSQYISYLILISKSNYKLNVVSFILIILGFVIFGYLTYNPLENYLFLDTTKNKYGINIYKI